MKKGFTLVELSIVLVIIGLLIGGILVAQSMIETAKVESFIRELGQFDAAMANFQTKYNYLPGDNAIMGCVNAGNSICNNGTIEDNNFPTYTVADTFTNEVANVWPNLQASGFLGVGGSTYKNTITGKFAAKGAAPNSPLMPLGTNTGVVVIGMLGNPNPGNSYVAVNTNFYVFCDFTNSNSALTGAPTDSISTACFDAGGESIPAADALAIDTKIDDGSPDVIFPTGSNVFDFGQRSCSTGHAYNLSNFFAGAPKCSLAIKMFTMNSAQQ